MEKVIILKNKASIQNIGKEYQPVIDGIVRLLRDHLKKNLIEIRLLGSVPRGCAIPGCSDIDFLAVTKTAIEPDDLSILKKSIDGIPFNSELLSRIDIQYMSEDDIGRHFAYRLIVMTDSVSIFGEDGYTVDEYSILNTDLAGLWTPNIDRIIADYRKALSSPDTSQADIIKYSRLTGKDIMKCFQRRVLLDHGIIEKSVERIYLNLAKYIPDYTDLFVKLWNLYRNPSVHIEDILTVLSECELAKDEIAGNKNPPAA